MIQMDLNREMSWLVITGGPPDQAHAPVSRRRCSVTHRWPGLARHTRWFVPKFVSHIPAKTCHSMRLFLWTITLIRQTWPSENLDFHELPDVWWQPMSGRIFIRAPPLPNSTRELVRGGISSGPKVLGCAIRSVTPDARNIVFGAGSFLLLLSLRSSARESYSSKTIRVKAPPRRDQRSCNL